MTKSILFCLLFLPLVLQAQVTAPASYDIGSPNVQDVWVDINNGSDSNSGNSEETALQTIQAAWNLIPINTPLTQGFQIKIKAGNYPSSSIPNYWENRLGTYQHPVILEAVDGEGTVTLQRDINAFNLHYFYLIGINIVNNGDAFHCEQCHYTLIRKTVLDGGNQAAHETVKVNQSQNFYLENSVIHGADDNAIDFVAVQRGHILNNQIFNANDWCVYVKGGSAYITIAGNEVFNCGTGGITAGQGSGLEFMTSPWLHYEAYDIKIFNNVIHHTEGAGLGVNGGYNILLAYNTLYHVGTRSHTIEFVFGERSCDGNNSDCNARVALGGWGPANSSIESQPIPNRNIIFSNNIIYNPTGVNSQWQHLAVYSPRSTTTGTNLPDPAVSDENLLISNNIFWNGTPSMPLGIGDSEGCANSNPTCNQAQLTSNNLFNTLEPQLANPSDEDFRPAVVSNLSSYPAIIVNDFPGGDREPTPLAAAGNLNNAISVDRAARSRLEAGVIGAYAFADWEIDPELPPVSPLPSQPPTISNIEVSKRRVLRQERFRISCQTDTTNISRVWVTLGNNITKDLPPRGNGRYAIRLRIKKKGRYPLTVRAANDIGETTQVSGRIVVRKVLPS